MTAHIHLLPRLTVFGGYLHFPLGFDLVHKHSDTYSAKDHQPSPFFARVLVKDFYSCLTFRHRASSV